MTLAFLLTSLVIVATPGTGVLYTLSAGLSRGTRASLVAALGCTLGIVPHMVAAITGLAAVLNASAVAFQSLKLLGVAYLLFMAVRMWRDRSELVVDEGAGSPGAPVRSARQVIWSAILINILNPKLTIFFFAFLPQFVHPDQPGALAHMTMLSGVFMAMTFVVFAIYGAFAAAVRSHVVSRPHLVRWMRRTFAGAFVALGVKLALTDR
ncbi:LysE family translocator [Cellulomonas sp. McL0617]|uniref:LysE family translocator n=1 Tax=Cellulomonas sp. McL0617 TaxID=3415675 RepID=UPI003CF1B9E7